MKQPSVGQSATESSSPPPQCAAIDGRSNSIKVDGRLAGEAVGRHTGVCDPIEGSEHISFRCLLAQRQAEQGLKSRTFVR